MFDHKIHKKHRTVGYHDQYSRKGAGYTVGTLFRKLVDLNGDEQIRGRNQQDDGADCGNASYKGRNKAA